MSFGRSGTLSIQTTPALRDTLPANTWTPTTYLSRPESSVGDDRRRLSRTGVSHAFQARAGPLRLAAYIPAKDCRRGLRRGNGQHDVRHRVEGSKGPAA